MKTKRKTVLQKNSVSEVWTEKDKNGEKKLYKKSPKYLTDNEIYALAILGKTGFVPGFTQIDDETITMDIIKEEEVTDKEKFKDECVRFCEIMTNYELRHGDLTRPHILPVNNSPIVIDWAESRQYFDPRPDKRREGDWYWLKKTLYIGWGIRLEEE